MADVLLDTCAVVHFYQNKKKVVELLTSYSHVQYFISFVTYAEFVGKVPIRQKKDARKFLRIFKTVPISASYQKFVLEACALYEIPKKQLPDFLIACTALQLKIPLVTENKKDFEKYQDLLLHTYSLS